MHTCALRATHTATQPRTHTRARADANGARDRASTHAPRHRSPALERDRGRERRRCSCAATVFVTLDISDGKNNVTRNAAVFLSVNCFHAIAFMALNKKQLCAHLAACVSPSARPGVCVCEGRGPVCALECGTAIKIIVTISIGGAEIHFQLAELRIAERLNGPHFRTQNINRNNRVYQKAISHTHAHTGERDTFDGVRLSGQRLSPRICRPNEGRAHTKS